jgi:hypothetical protein
VSFPPRVTPLTPTSHHFTSRPIGGPHWPCCRTEGRRSVRKPRHNSLPMGALSASVIGDTGQYFSDSQGVLSYVQHAGD